MNRSVPGSSLLALLLACSSPPSELPAGLAGVGGSSPNAGPVAGAGSGGAASTGEVSVGAAGALAGIAGASSAGSPTNGGSAAGGSAAAAGSGAGGAATGTGAAGAGGGASQGTPTFVAVGYAGRRVRSVDLGLTWTDDQVLGGGGDDDEFLLRGVTFGNGVFVAVGYQILTSLDGAVWQARSNPQHQWLGGVVYQGGSFVAVGGYGYSARSSDGATWSVTGTVGNNQASRSLAFGIGLFVAGADGGASSDWYQSTNGDSWSLLSQGHASNQVAFCAGAFQEYASCQGVFDARGRATANGVTIRVADGKLQRAAKGSDFSAVGNSPQGIEDVAVGSVE